MPAGGFPSKSTSGAQQDLGLNEHPYRNLSYAPGSKHGLALPTCILKKLCLAKPPGITYFMQHNCIRLLREVQKGDSEEDIKSQLGKARTAFNKPGNIHVWKSSQLKLTTKLKIFMSNVIDVLLHECETWRND